MRQSLLLFALLPFCLLACHSNRLLKELENELTQKPNKQAPCILNKVLASPFVQHNILENTIKTKKGLRISDLTGNFAFCVGNIGNEKIVHTALKVDKNLPANLHLQNNLTDLILFKDSVNSNKNNILDIFFIDSSCQENPLYSHKCYVYRAEYNRKLKIIKEEIFNYAAPTTATNFPKTPPTNALNQMILDSILASNAIKGLFGGKLVPSTNKTIRIFDKNNYFENCTYDKFQNNVLFFNDLALDINTGHYYDLIIEHQEKIKNEHRFYLICAFDACHSPNSTGNAKFAAELSVLVYNNQIKLELLSAGEYD